MGWIRRETEKGTTQYICPNCHDYHEFREDFGEQTFSENFIFCRRCGARNGTGTAPTLTPPNEWVSVNKRLPEKRKDVLVHYGNGRIGIDWIDSTQCFVFDELYGRVTHWLPIPELPDRRPPEEEA